MQQIAEQAGVSKYAVSKALSGQPGVSEETRERIIRIAAQMGYFLQDREEQKVAQKRLRKADYANTVIVLLPNVRMQSTTSSFWGKILDGVTNSLMDRGFGTILITEHSPENFLRVVNPSGILGLIGIGVISTSLLLEINKIGIPFVLIDHEDDSVLVDTVFANNFDSIRQLTHYLIGLGHRVLQFVGDPSFSRSFYDRWLGFRAAIEDSGLKLVQTERLVSNLGVTQSEQIAVLTDVLEEMVRQGTLPTAFVCANDALAISLLSVLEQLGIRVPEEVSVSGFDDIEDALKSTPQLTTVRVNKEMMGSRAVDLLIRRIRNSDAPRERLLICGEIVLRGSTATCKQLEHIV